MDCFDRWRGVAPFAGAWIEITNGCKAVQDKIVAPFAGAWIEIVYCENEAANLILSSLPSRERGLKYPIEKHRESLGALVAPFAGAWIEILRC